MLSGLTYNVFLGMHLRLLLQWLYTDNELLDFYCTVLLFDMRFFCFPVSDRVTVCG